MYKELVMAIYDMDDNIITAVFSDRSVEDYYVPDYEDTLETTAAMRSQLELLLENDVYTYVQLMLSGSMMEYLGGIASDMKTQRLAVRDDLGSVYDDATANYLAREFMMYDY